MGHNVMAVVLIALRRHDEAIAAAERGYELAPGDFSVNNQRGQTLAYAGRYEEALPWFDRALAAEPEGPVHLLGLPDAFDRVCSACSATPKWLPLRSECRGSCPNGSSAHTMMAAGYIGLGQLPPGHTAIDNARKLDPRLTVRRVMRQPPVAQ